jgi:hypothetical protein
MNEPEVGDWWGFAEAWQVLAVTKRREMASENAAKEYQEAWPPLVGSLLRKIKKSPFSKLSSFRCVSLRKSFAPIFAHTQKR